VSGRAALITRPQADAHLLSTEVRRRGFEPLLEPLLEIRSLAGPAPMLEDLQGVLITSANGARSLVERLGTAYNDWRQVPLWAVGDASAAEARRLGFTQVQSADGDVVSLCRQVSRDADPAGGRLLHVTGDRQAGDLAGCLIAGGFRVERLVLYHSVAVQALSPAAVTALRQNRVAAALFFSPGTATTFVRLAAQQQLAECCRAVSALCLSPAVAAALADITWNALQVAERPRQDALLAILDGV
jgi:uroporphyrinogen-III synthase